MKFYVYVHKRKTDGSIFYVGKGCGKRAWKKVCRSDWWKRIEAKHGRTVEIIKRDLTEDEAFSFEAEMVAKIGRETLCNLTDGGEGGKCPSEETRRKMSAAQKGRIVSQETREKKRIAATGRTHSEEARAKIKAARAKQVMGPMPDSVKAILKAVNANRIISPETCKKISESKTGVKLGPMSEEHKNKLRIANIGKKHTEEAKAKVSKANKGRKHTQEAMEKIIENNRKHNEPRRKPIRCSNGIVFGYSLEAQNWLRENGFPTACKANVVSCCTGKLKTAYGFKWCYAIE